jgi:pyrimidine-nucleoside phosphorylase
MRAVDIIMKKRNGEILNEQEIKFIVGGCVKGNIPDYQISAFLMAVYFQGMSFGETMLLTKEMMLSGKVMEYKDIEDFIIDKHSTGGVGDKTTMILAPMVVASGGKVASIAGRGLGHTGGTVDKLESIEGFTVEINTEHFYKAVKEVGCGLIGQTKDIAPADKILYALRDVTATVESIPLITASIMSKKLAEGIDGLVLDVKTGSGAFMKTLDDSYKLAISLVEIGKRMGKKVCAFITDMNQPLGRYVGNSLEIKECIETMKNNGPEDLTRLCVELSGYMLYLSGKAESFGEAKKITRSTLEDGSALNKFKEIIKSQGGNPNVCHDYKLLPEAKHQTQVFADKRGFVNEIQTEKIGLASMYLGGGRAKMDDKLDYAVGLRMEVKLGDRIEKGKPLATIYYNPSSNLTDAKKLIEKACLIENERKTPPELIYDIIDIS